MNPMLIGALIGGGLGLLKNSGDKKSAAEERKIQALREKWSPWTGQHGNSVQDPSLLGNVMQGGLAGLGVGQSVSGIQNAGAALAGGETAEAGATVGATGAQAEAPKTWDMTKPQEASMASRFGTDKDSYFYGNGAEMGPPSPYTAQPAYAAEDPREFRAQAAAGGTGRPSPYRTR